MIANKILRTLMRNLAGASLLLAVWLMAPGLQAREPGPQPKVEAQHVETKPLAGVPGKVIDIQIYTFPPKSAVPWHIHKDAVEIEYGLQGTIMLEEEGKPPYPIEQGKTNILAPNVVHRGWNPSETEPAKLYVVRIKPKGAPLATLVETPAGAKEAPATGVYPQDEKPGN